LTVGIHGADMRIAVTGGSGSVGKHVIAKAVAMGHSVRNIDRVQAPEGSIPAGVEYVNAELSDYQSFHDAIDGFDVLIHLAAIPAPGGYPEHVVHNNNVTSSYNALLAAAKVGIKRVVQASSINAIGAVYSRWPTYEYLPVTELHPTYSEDPYSLSKWICEIQGDAMARRYEDMTIASLRFHWVVANLEMAQTRANNNSDSNAKQLWAYTLAESAARACLAILDAPYVGHEAFYIVAPTTVMAEPTADLIAQWWPKVPLTQPISGHNGVYDCSKAARLLGWTH
jgi:nucleoside-diphosphate-sugar epimerase